MDDEIKGSLYQYLYILQRHEWHEQHRFGARKAQV